MTTLTDKDTLRRAIHDIAGFGFGLSLEDINLIISKMKPLTIKKGEAFSEKGQTCKRLGILISGLLYAHYETDEKIIVSRFFYIERNPIVCSFDSFKNIKASNETIQAIEDSYLLCFENSDLKTLYEKIPKMAMIGKSLAEDSYIQALARIHDLQALKPEERLKKFIDEHPGLINRIKRQHIASYTSMNRNLLTQTLKKLNKC